MTSRLPIFATAILLASVSYGQDTELNGLLDELIQKYSETAVASIEFELELQMAESDPEVYPGQFYKKAESYHIATEMQTVISDGEDAWIYIPDNEEIQIVDVEEDDDMMSPDGLLNKFYSDEYKYRSRKTDVPGELLVEFVPEDSDDDIFKVQMLIDEKTKTVKQIKAFEKSGDQYTMKLKSQDFSATLDDALFVFDKSKYPGVHVEDLRID